MTVNTKPLLPQTGSLIERASQAFDLGLKRVNDTAPSATDAHLRAVKSDAAPASAAQGKQLGPKASVDLERLRENGFIIPGAPTTILSEEFRLIKRTLLLAAMGGTKSMALPNGRLIQVCSGQPNEGKTFTAVNLALSLASERDIDVLLVDADVAKPEVLSTLGLPGTLGLMDALVDHNLNIEQLIIQTNIPKLSVLPAGRAASNDTEALASEYAHELIQKLIAQNPKRIVVFDSAPALAASPAGVLAHHVGQILMVVRADQTGEPELREALGLLNGCPNIHLMLNSVTYFGNTKKYGAYYGLGD
jgi:exopolysaccharide/PEP-CTERM locus tyrosine autokinase